MSSSFDRVRLGEYDVRMNPSVVAVFVAAASIGCSSSPGDGGASGTPTATLDTSKKLSELGAGDFPLLCDAVAMEEGGYGAMTVKKNCGNAFSS